MKTHSARGRCLSLSGKSRFRQTAPTHHSSPLREKLSGAQDSELIEIYLQGEERAFAEIVSRYRERLINYIYRVIRDKERAEDLVQEVFIRVYRHLHHFDRSKKFSTWIYTIASNLTKNELRNRSRNPLVLFTTLARSSSDTDDTLPLEFEDIRLAPDRLLHKRDLVGSVERAVSRLNRHFREVFVLREIEGRSYEEISQILGVNLGTVKSRLNRARCAFAEIIRPHA